MILFYMHALPLYVTLLFIHLFICYIFFLFLFSRFCHMVFLFFLLFSLCMTSFQKQVFGTSALFVFLLFCLALSALFVFACLSFLFSKKKKVSIFCFYSYVFLNILLFLLSFFNFCCFLCFSFFCPY